MVLLDVTATAEPAWTGYMFTSRMIVTGTFLLAFFTWDWIQDWLEQWFLVSIFRVRVFSTRFYLSLRSRLILSPFIVALIFVMPRPDEPESSHLLLRAGISAVLVLIILVLFFWLGWQGAERF